MPTFSITSIETVWPAPFTVGTVKPPLQSNEPIEPEQLGVKTAWKGSRAGLSTSRTSVATVERACAALGAAKIENEAATASAPAHMKVGLGNFTFPPPWNAHKWTDPVGQIQRPPERLRWIVIKSLSCPMRVPADPS